MTEKIFCLFQELYGYISMYRTSSDSYLLATTYYFASWATRCWSMITVLVKINVRKSVYVVSISSKVKKVVVCKSS